MKTALYDRHVSLGGKIVNFCDWEMPLHYAKGTVYEQGNAIWHKKKHQCEVHH